MPYLPHSQRLRVEQESPPEPEPLLTPEMQARRAAEAIVDATTEALKAAGTRGLPSGHLYAMLMGVITYEAYQRLIEGMKRCGLVEERNHVVRWVGRGK